MEYLLYLMFRCDFDVMENLWEVNTAEMLSCLRCIKDIARPVDSIY